jgi:type VI secretion system protein ImpM
MIRGLFGKLPAKRDFVAAQIPPGVLHPLETWLQTSLAVSRQQMGGAWIEAYLTAPIWRFWIGSSVFGQAVIGAMMPSLDGVGRYFPLSAMVIAPPDRCFAPPGKLPQDEWFFALEDVLLRALEPETTYEAVTAAFEALPSPVDQPQTAVGGVERITGNAVRALAATPEELMAALAMAQAEEMDDTLRHLTFWWTLGGEAFPAQALSTRQMPPSDVFSAFLLARSARPPEVEPA